MKVSTSSVFSLLVLSVSAKVLTISAYEHPVALEKRAGPSQTAKAAPWKPLEKYIATLRSDFKTKHEHAKTWKAYVASLSKAYASAAKHNPSHKTQLASMYKKYTTAFATAKLAQEAADKSATPLHSAMISLDIMKRNHHRVASYNRRNPKTPRRFKSGQKLNVPTLVEQLRDAKNDVSQSKRQFHSVKGLVSKKCKRVLSKTRMPVSGLERESDENRTDLVVQKQRTTLPVDVTVIPRPINTSNLSGQDQPGSTNNACMPATTWLTSGSDLVQCIPHHSNGTIDVYFGDWVQHNHLHQSLNRTPAVQSMASTPLESDRSLVVDLRKESPLDHNEQSLILCAKSVFDATTGLQLVCILALLDGQIYLAILADPLMNGETNVSILVSATEFSSADPLRLQQSRIVDGPMVVIDGGEMLMAVYETFPGTREFIGVRLNSIQAPVIDSWSDPYTYSLHILVRTTHHDSVYIEHVTIRLDLSKTDRVTPHIETTVVPIPDYVAMFALSSCTIPCNGKNGDTFAVLTSLGRVGVFTGGRLDWSVDITAFGLTLISAKMCVVCNSNSILYLTTRYANTNLALVFKEFDACLVDVASQKIITVYALSKETLNTSTRDIVIRVESPVDVFYDKPFIDQAFSQSDDVNASIIRLLTDQYSIAKQNISDLNGQIGIKKAALLAGRRYLSNLSSIVLIDPDCFVLPDPESMTGVLCGMVVIDAQTGMRSKTQSSQFVDSSPTSDGSFQKVQAVCITQCSAVTDIKQYEAHLRITLHNTSNSPVYNATVLASYKSRRASKIICKASSCASVAPNETVTVLCRIHICQSDRAVSEIHVLVVPIYQLSLDSPRLHGLPRIEAAIRAQSSLQLICPFQTTLIWHNRSFNAYTITDIKTCVCNILRCKLDTTQKRAVHHAFHVEFDLLNDTLQGETSTCTNINPESLKKVSLELKCIDETTFFDCLNKLLAAFPELRQ
ncbi:hypothetical protein BASA83_008423 [Batrachochytrium salamandrivorans]|nr:hypothetical protein BASA83_008423 [Batrachochytrium salamandrivorans]